MNEAWTQRLRRRPGLRALPHAQRPKLLLLPCAGLAKTTALRGSGRDVSSDERTAVGHQMVACSVYDNLRLIYPSCYPVHELAGDWGKERPDAPGRVVLPPTAPAGIEYFNPGAPPPRGASALGSSTAKPSPPPAGSSLPGPCPSIPLARRTSTTPPPY